ncbi:UNVERIFIED_CONTAM: hypothetical protein GTU68_048658 [Idotea baltica]|nr:hypothetical protein [Idotea baltica]
MGKGFGELAYIRGLVKYSLSPFEQRAFAGMITKGIPNTFRRFAESGVKVLPRKCLLYYTKQYFLKL